MYEAFYGLKEKPFLLTPDPDFLYFSPGHKRALTYLTYALESQEGFVQLTGEIGSGKTTILRNLLRSLAPNIKTACIVNPRGTFRQLMRTILDELDVVPMKTELSKEKLLREFRGYLEQQAEAGARVVLIFDEAQNLDATVLEEIRMLSNYETDKRKLVQIVLVGQPELRNKLKLPELEQLYQRIAVRCHLGPLSMEDTGRYIEHRLHVAGAANGAVRFAPEASAYIYERTRGVPRLINILCNAVLLAGFVEEKKHFTSRDVATAAADLAEAEGETLESPAAPAAPVAPAPAVPPVAPVQQPVAQPETEAPEIPIIPVVPAPVQAPLASAVQPEAWPAAVPGVPGRPRLARIALVTAGVAAAAVIVVYILTHYLQR